MISSYKYSVTFHHFDEMLPTCIRFRKIKWAHCFSRFIRIWHYGKLHSCYIERISTVTLTQPTQITSEIRTFHHIEIVKLSDLVTRVKVCDKDYFSQQITKIDTMDINSNYTRLEIYLYKTMHDPKYYGESNHISIKSVKY